MKLVRKYFIKILLLCLGCVILFSCSKEGKKNNNENPEISQTIISSEEKELSSEKESEPIADQTNLSMDYVNEEAMTYQYFIQEEQHLVDVFGNNQLVYSVNYISLDEALDDLEELYAEDMNGRLFSFNQLKFIDTGWLIEIKNNAVPNSEYWPVSYDVFTPSGLYALEIITKQNCRNSVFLEKDEEGLIISIVNYSTGSSKPRMFWDWYVLGINGDIEVHETYNYELQLSTSPGSAPFLKTYVDENLLLAIADNTRINYFDRRTYHAESAPVTFPIEKISSNDFFDIKNVERTNKCIVAEYEICNFDDMSEEVYSFSVDLD